MKKKSGHDVKYIEEFLSKLYEEKKKLDKKVKKEEEKSQKLNSKRSNYPISNYSTNSNITKSNIIIRNKSQLEQLTQEQKMINSLKEIFDFYANQHNPMASAPTFDEIAYRKINLDLAEFSKFCVEFEIPISKLKMAELFKKNTSNRRDMSFNEFKNSLEKIGQAMNESKKENLEKKIKLYHDLLEKMNINDDIIQDFKRKSVFVHEINLNNPNKNNIRNSHRLNTKNASVILNDKKNLYEKELNEFENELDRLKKLSYKGVFEEFVKFVGLNDPKVYRKKMKGFIIPFHDMTERVLQFNGNYKLKKISRNDVIEKMKRDLHKFKDNSNNKYNQYYMKKIREQKEKEEIKDKLYEKRMKKFIEDKKKKIAFLKDEDRKEKERLKRAKLTPEEIKKEIELQKEKERLELEKQREEEERKRQEEIKKEEDRRKNVFSFERIEKSGLNDIDVNNELNNDLFIDDGSENSDEEILNLFGNKNNNKDIKQETESINKNYNYPKNDNESKNEEIINISKNDLKVNNNENNNENNNNENNNNENNNYENNNYENNNNENNNNENNNIKFYTIDNDIERENVLLTQQGNKNIVLMNNIDKPHNRRIQSLDYNNNLINRNNSLTISTDINLPSQNYNTDLSSENIILSYNNNNGSQSERRSKSKTFIKTGENIIKGNKRQVSAFYGKNYNIPVSISELNENKEYSKKKKFLFAGRVQKNQENILNNQIIANAKLIKKIEKVINYNNSDYNLRKKYDN